MYGFSSERGGGNVIGRDGREGATIILLGHIV
jgi:hypothetical protein